MTFWKKMYLSYLFLEVKQLFLWLLFTEKELTW